MGNEQCRGHLRDPGVHGRREVRCLLGKPAEERDAVPRAELDFRRGAEVGKLVKREEWHSGARSGKFWEGGRGSASGVEHS